MWVLFLLSFYLARYVALGFALLPAYLVLVNALTHVAASVALRRYNPGLYTSILLFFPAGFFVLVYLGGVVRSDLLFNALGLAVAVLEHTLIAAYATARRNKLASNPRTGVRAES